MRPFGEHIKKLLAERGLSQRAFALKIGMKPPNLHDIIAGTWPMPVRRIDRCIDALGLKGADAKEFRLEALLTRCPAEIQDLVHHLRNEIPAKSGRSTKSKE